MTEYFKLLSESIGNSNGITLSYSHIYANNQVMTKCELINLGEGGFVIDCTAHAVDIIQSTEKASEIIYNSLFNNQEKLSDEGISLDLELPYPRSLYDQDKYDVYEDMSENMKAEQRSIEAGKRSLYKHILDKDLDDYMESESMTDSMSQIMINKKNF